MAVSGIPPVLSFEHVSCNVCGEDDTEPLTAQNGFRMVRCRMCGLAYLNPRPPQEAMLSLYADYHARNGGDEASWERLMSRVFRESANLLEAALAGAQPLRLLDIGCGFGSFVALMRQRGWDAEGIDPSPAAIASALGKGRPVRMGTMEQLREERRIYDALTMFYVLEHLPDPMGALRKTWDLLAPGGVLLIRVPHTTPIVRLLSPLGLGGTLYDPPFHLYDFSPAVLGEMLRRTGFAKVRTLPGTSTLPSRIGPRIASTFFSLLAAGLYALTRGVVLLPGVSKTTIARKPSD